MSNALRGRVSFECKDKRYTLSYSTNALVELEEALNLSVVDIGKMMSQPDKFRMKTLRTVFWVGLMDNHPAITQDDVAELLKNQLPNETTDLVSRAFALTFPTPEGGDVRPQKEAGNGTTSLPVGNQ